jgi:hypothetical protein
MSWAMGGILAFGVFVLIHGIRIRAGESRSFYPLYRTNFVFRNAPFTSIPGGIWLIAGAGTIIASHHDAGVAVAVLAPITLVTVMLSVVWLFKPPNFMKPRWLREVDSGAAPSRQRAFTAPRAKPARAGSTFHPSSTGACGSRRPSSSRSSSH